MPQLISSHDVQQGLAAHIRNLRRQQRISRDALAARSTVPAPTIKKFETTGQISLRQFLLLWECVDTLARLDALTDVQASDMKTATRVPQSIEDVLNDPF